MKKNGTEVLIKIKIPNFDIRLYTFEKFINSKGEILFIFDKSGNHAKLAQEHNNSTGLIPTICNSKEYKENKGDKSIKMATAEQYESMNEYYNNFKPLDELISLKPLNRLSVQSTSKQVKVSFNHGTLWDPMMMEILDNPIKLNLDSNKTLYSLISIQTESPYNVTVSGAIQQLLEISHDD